MNNLPAAASRAMAVQAKRLHRAQTPDEIIADLRVQLAERDRELKAAQDENMRLAAENESLRCSVLKSAVNGANNGEDELFVNGRLVVNQAEAAKRLNVKQYQISRWLKAGKFMTVAVPGHKKPMIYADSLHKPERGQPGRKRK